MLFEDPLNYLRQIKWFLGNTESEQFPGAFNIAAGHFCRCVVEQEYLIIGALANLPIYALLNTQLDRRLLPLRIIKETFNKKPTSSSPHETCWEAAQSRGPRAKKHADFGPRLEYWSSVFNEPSHSSPPTHVREVNEEEIQAFYDEMSEILDDKDKDLFIAAYNQIISEGKYQIDFIDDEDNTPSIKGILTMNIQGITINPDGELSFKTPTFPLKIVDQENEPKDYASDSLIIIKNSTPTLQWNLVNEEGDPIDYTNTGTILNSLCYGNPEKVMKVIEMLKEGGHTIEIFKEGS